MNGFLKKQSPRTSIAGYNIKWFVARLKMNREFSSFVLVEGDTDTKYYGRFINIDTCRITAACKNRENVERTIKACNEAKVRGVIGIADADMDRLAGTLDETIENLFYTDTADLETQIIDREIFEGLIWEKADPYKCRQLEKSEGITLYDYITVLCRRLSVLYYLNSKYHLGLHLKDEERRLARWFGDGLSFDWDGLLDYLIKNRGNQEITNEEIAKYQADAEEIFAKNDSILRGHSFTSLIAAILSRPEIAREDEDIFYADDSHQSKKRVEKWFVESMLRMCTPKFLQTELCQKIRDWQKANPGHQILKPEYS